MILVVAQHVHTLTFTLPIEKIITMKNARAKWFHIQKNK